MTIIESLKKLGKSLLGDNYTPTEAKTDSQIAETIEGISKAIDDAGGIGGGGAGGGRIIELTPGSSQGTFLPIEPNLPIEYFAGACIGALGQYVIIKSIFEDYDGQGNVTAYNFDVETPGGNNLFVYFLSDGSISIAD